VDPRVRPTDRHPRQATNIRRVPKMDEPRGHEPGELLWAEEIPGGKHWSFVLRRGTLLRLVDLTGDANVGMLFYNPANPLERYNAPDTLKCQHTFKLTRGNCLYSDMGRIFCSIVDDTVG